MCVCEREREWGERQRGGEEKKGGTMRYIATGVMCCEVEQSRAE